MMKNYITDVYKNKMQFSTYILIKHGLEIIYYILYNKYTNINIIYYLYYMFYSQDKTIGNENISSNIQGNCMKLKALGWNVKPFDSFHDYTL